MSALGTWVWEIPVGSSLTTERVELGLHLFGREVVRLNGKIINRRFVFGLKSTHEFALSDGRQVKILIVPEAGSRTLAPAVTLTIGPDLVPPTQGRLPLKPRPTPPVPPITPTKKGILVLFELYLLLTPIGFAIYFYQISHPALLPQMRMLRPFIFVLVVIDLVLLISRVKIWREGKKTQQRYLEALFRSLFQSHWGRRQARHVYPMSGNALLTGHILIAALCFGFGSLPLFIHAKLDSGGRIAWGFLFLMFNGFALWICHLLWASARDAKRKGTAWAKAAEERLERSEERRVDNAAHPKRLNYRLKLLALLLISAVGLFVFFGISSEAKASFVWNHHSMQSVFYLNGIITFSSIMGAFTEYLFFAPFDQTG